MYRSRSIDGMADGLGAYPAKRDVTSFSFFLREGELHHTTNNDATVEWIKMGS